MMFKAIKEWFENLSDPLEDLLFSVVDAVCTFLCIKTPGPPLYGLLRYIVKSHQKDDLLPNTLSSREITILLMPEVQYLIDVEGESDIEACVAATCVFRGGIKNQSQMWDIYKEALIEYRLKGDTDAQRIIIHLVKTDIRDRIETWEG